MWHKFCTFAGDLNESDMKMRMKKSIFVILMAMVSVVGFAQPPHHGDHHGDHRGHGHKGHHEPPRQEVRYIEAATPEQVMMVLDVVGKQSFDDKKMEVAKLSAALVSFRVDDLARIAKLFSFESNKVEFLKFAYATCYDPEHYYLLKDCLRFSSDFDELMEAVMPGYRR